MEEKLPSKDTSKVDREEIEGFVYKSRPLAVPDDLAFELGAHPDSPERRAVFLRNRNTSRGIIASIEVKAASSLIVETLDRVAKKQRWPLQFEVRVAPGSRVLLGLETFRVINSISFSPDPVPPTVDQEYVDQSYRILGAYYHNPPLPAPVEDPADWLWVYSARMLGHDYYQATDFMVNLHPTRQIEIHATALPSEIGFSAAVIPGYQLQVSAAPERQRFRVSSIKFI